MDFLSVDIATHACRVAEDITHRDVMPAPVVDDAALGGPAVPTVITLVAGSRGRREEEARAGGAVHLAEAERPVLVGGASLRPAFTDQVDIGALAETIQFHPGLQGDCVTVLEIETTGWARVG